MNYPIKVKKAFTRVRYQVQDAWQNLRILRRHITCLVRSIDDVGSRVNRSRQLLQDIALSEGYPGNVQTERGVQGGGYP
jgi:hypothetical protein